MREESFELALDLVPIGSFADKYVAAAAAAGLDDVRQRPVALIARGELGTGVKRGDHDARVVGRCYAPGDLIPRRRGPEPGEKRRPLRGPRASPSTVIRQKLGHLLTLPTFTDGHVSTVVMR